MGHQHSRRAEKGCRREVGRRRKGWSFTATNAWPAMAKMRAGKPVDALVGGIGTLKSKNPQRTVGSFWPHATTLFDYIRRAMPYAKSKVLTNDELYALCAFILARNGIIAEDFVLDAKSLPQVKMPNRDGFINAWPDKQ